MKIKRRYILALVVVGIAVFAGWKVIKAKQTKTGATVEITVERGDIEVAISTTGTVEPQNRLEMKPPISGRIDEILVQEGDQVKKGQIVAWMSSTERAALLDAARSKDAATLSYWEDAYKPTPLIAPIDGDVIVRSVEPGQTVTSADPVVVLSDRLIVKAQVDETDIGRVQLGQKASLSLDAYPRNTVEASVDHVAYESQLVNNVTIYEVDILPLDILKMFRSGMSANVNIVESSRENVLRLPVGAVRREQRDTSVLVKEGRGAPKSRKIETGSSDGEYIEVVSGLNEGDIVVIEKKGAGLPKKSSAKNPFMPTPGGGSGGRNR